MFHISFNGKLPRILNPRQPDGSTPVSKGFTEDLPPRVSFTPTIAQCFYAIYPNISHLYEVENKPYLDFYVYVPKKPSELRLIPKDVVLKNILDAHITEEICVLNSVEIIQSSKVRIRPLKDEIWFHPFGDNKKDKMFLSPKISIVELTVHNYNW